MGDGVLDTLEGAFLIVGNITAFPRVLVVCQSFTLGCGIFLLVTFNRWYAKHAFVKWTDSQSAHRSHFDDSTRDAPHKAIYLSQPAECLLQLTPNGRLGDVKSLYQVRHAIYNGFK